MSNRKKCTVYIDEAGDLGIGRGTRWFVLTGVVVNEDDEKRMRQLISKVKSRLNKKTIHFRELRNFDQRSYVISEINKGSFEYANVILDTLKINIKAKHPDEVVSVVTYNYACRILLERISWLLRDSGREGKVILSSRGTSRDQELIDYIQDKLIPYSQNTIENYFTGVTSKTASQWDMLQLADICATSTFYYYEPNRFGFITPCYTLRIGKHLYKHNGEIDKYGVKYYDESMKPGRDYFIEKMICK